MHASPKLQEERDVFLPRSTGAAAATRGPTDCLAAGEDAADFCGISANRNRNQKGEKGRLRWKTCQCHCRCALAPSAGCEPDSTSAFELSSPRTVPEGTGKGTFKGTTIFKLVAAFFFFAIFTCCCNGGRGPEDCQRLLRLPGIDSPPARPLEGALFDKSLR
jgi:hypothetical protein